MRLLFTISCSVILFNSWGQCPTAAYSIGSSLLCQGEEVGFTNQSVNGTTYTWDLCGGDLVFEPTAEGKLVDNALRQSFDFELLYNAGNWYGILSSINTVSYKILAYGDSLGSVPAVSS